ncbi:D-alanyl-D-alanine carboxypeptidase family protein [Aliiroseovarius subalbicans]|uniref:D-alanyl-D-alanine carboxypeptidase family protein n=1 Tax=Aliiroseovarius subalbicans TaxID=2925840 RepID=UPI001F5AEF8A|nr:D-alanyl-D-alanine carboxypeptidase family protein [Aliiroseovarius subalbicans]MCI2399248.1 D-alanyl-D-alanine carboxypeptidase [Aliiroseovarius subalbicans]
MRRFALIAALAAAALALALPARAFDTRASSAFVLDVATGTVLLEKQADVPLPPASMSKLMTVNMMFEALADSRLGLETRLGVSSRAAAMGGSTMFLNTSDRPTVDELLQGIIVQSGNDACVAVAEALGGTEDAFAAMMTERASDLGMMNSSFGNSSGWPHPMQRMSMRDLALLAKRLIVEFPQYYPYFSQTEFPFDGRAPDNRFNRNPLLKLGIGADGLKTGHTSEAGYGLVGSALQGKRRIVFVISGLTSEKARAEEAEAIVNWAFRQFAMKTAVKAGERLAEAPVWLGQAASVGLVAREDVDLLIPALQRDGLEATITWNGPIEAPIAEGQELAQMVITRKALPEVTVPLYAETGVGAAGFMPRFRAAATKVLGMVQGGDAPAPVPMPVTN